MSWTGERNWVVPPPKLATEVVGKITQERAPCILIVPLWKSAPYWPLIAEGDAFKTFVKRDMSFDKSQYVKPGRRRNGMFTDRKQSFKMIALLVKFD